MLPSLYTRLKQIEFNEIVIKRPGTGVNEFLHTETLVFYSGSGNKREVVTKRI